MQKKDNCNLINSYIDNLVRCTIAEGMKRNGSVEVFYIMSYSPIE